MNNSTNSIDKKQQNDQILSENMSKMSDIVNNFLNLTSIPDSEIQALSDKGENLNNLYFDVGIFKTCPITVVQAVTIVNSFPTLIKRICSSTMFESYRQNFKDYFDLRASLFMFSLFVVFYRRSKVISDYTINFMKEAINDVIKEKSRHYPALFFFNMYDKEELRHIYQIDLLNFLSETDKQKQIDFCITIIAITLIEFENIATIGNLSRRLFDDENTDRIFSQLPLSIFIQRTSLGNLEETINTLPKEGALEAAFNFKESFGIFLAMEENIYIFQKHISLIGDWLKDSLTDEQFKIIQQKIISSDNIGQWILKLANYTLYWVNKVLTSSRDANIGYLLEIVNKSNLDLPLRMPLNFLIDFKLRSSSARLTMDPGLIKILHEMIESMENVIPNLFQELKRERELLK